MHCIVWLDTLSIEFFCFLFGFWYLLTKLLCISLMRTVYKKQIISHIGITHVLRPFFRCFFFTSLRLIQKYFNKNISYFFLYTNVPNADTELTQTHTKSNLFIHFISTFYDRILCINWYKWYYIQLKCIAWMHLR